MPNVLDTGSGFIYPTPCTLVPIPLRSISLRRDRETNAHGTDRPSGGRTRTELLSWLTPLRALLFHEGIQITPFLLAGTIWQP